MVYLWRAVDQEGEVLESYVTRTRDKGAALTFMKKALKRHGSPEAITTEPHRVETSSRETDSNPRAIARPDLKRDRRTDVWPSLSGF